MDYLFFLYHVKGTESERDLLSESVRLTVEKEREIKELRDQVKNMKHYEKITLAKMSSSFSGLLYREISPRRLLRDLTYKG